jgi:hypothetical protein
MRRAHIALFALFFLIVAVAAWATPPPEHRGVPVAVSGVYSVTFNLTIASTLPSGAVITCKAQIVPAQSLLQSQSQQGAVTPIESAAGIATVTGSTATCPVEIPFTWTLASAKEGVGLSYEIDAFNVPGTLPTVVRTSLQQGIPEAFPASGATSSVSFSVNF